MNTTSLQRYETRIARSTFTNIVFNCSKIQLGQLPKTGHYSPGLCERIRQF